MKSIHWVSLFGFLVAAVGAKGVLFSQVCSDVRTSAWILGVGATLVAPQIAIQAIQALRGGTEVKP